MQKDRELVDKEAGTLRVFQQCLVGSKCLQQSRCVGSGPSLNLGDPPPSSIDQHDYHGFLQLSTKPTRRHISNTNLHFSRIHLR